MQRNENKRQKAFVLYDIERILSAYVEGTSADISVTR